MDHSDFEDEAVALVRHWLTESAAFTPDRAARQLAGLLAEPAGLGFAVGFVDGVIRPEDPQVAAANLIALARRPPKFLAYYLKVALRTGAVAARVTPQLVIPLARLALRKLVGHLVVDASDRHLAAALHQIRAHGTRLNINLLGEAVLGAGEAHRRLAGTKRLLERDDVDYVSIKVSAAVAPHSLWAFDEAVDDVAATLTPLYQLAAEHQNPKFINLDMEEYHDLHLTMAAFRAILDQPALHQLSAGIVIQAYLPESLSAVMELTDWARARVETGGAPIKIRLVKGANLPMERVEAELRSWPLATWSTKEQTDTSYIRIVNFALTSANLDAVRIGIAGHNLFDIAYTWLLAKQRGVDERVEFEMLLGMAPTQAAVVQRAVGNLLRYTPVVHPDEFDAAIAYLIRRLEEGASQENFMSAVFELATNSALFAREEQRFRASVAGLDRTIPNPARNQNRITESPTAPLDGFGNVADTDASLLINRQWGRDILRRAQQSIIGRDRAEAAWIGTAETVDNTVRSAAAAGAIWGARPALHRANVLHAAGVALAQRRAQLIEVMVAEGSKTIDQADPEVSEAIDFAHYYAERAVDLEHVDGATFQPVQLTLVTPPWNFPIAIAAGSTLAALATGSAVILKPAPQAARCAAVLVEALWKAGVPQQALQLVQVDEQDLGQRLVAHPLVDQVILTGAYQTAELFHSFRPDIRLLAETSGKNAIVVTPSADIDLAVKDIINSAFGHAGQKCSAASLAILVGSVSKSHRFISQLRDGVQSLQVGAAWSPVSQMGPLIAPATGKLLEGLTTLGPGEHWMIRPRQLDTDGQLWSPGIRMGVQPGSAFHLTEYFGPVLGIMLAPTLEEAIKIQNAVDFGLTAGIHALDREEIKLWLDGVQAGNLYVNRGITGAIVQRQPFGGWKKSAVGPGAKAGGPNYLISLGSWICTLSRAHQMSIEPSIARIVATFDSDGYLARAARSDQAAWESEFGVSHDPAGLIAERNILRYVPAQVEIRLVDGDSKMDLLRIVMAANRASATVTISVPPEVPTDGIDAIQETEQVWVQRMQSGGSTRIRLVGGSTQTLGPIITTLGRRSDLSIYQDDVTEAGRIELLPFVREQAISMTAHRFGTPSALVTDLL